MLTFVFIFVGAILALLVVQSWDIECENKRVVRRKPAEKSFPPYAAMREVR